MSHDFQLIRQCMQTGKWRTKDLLPQTVDEAERIWEVCLKRELDAKRVAPVDGGSILIELEKGDSELHIEIRHECGVVCHNRFAVSRFRNDEIIEEYNMDYTEGQFARFVLHRINSHLDWLHLGQRKS